MGLIPLVGCIENEMASAVLALEAIVNVESSPVIIPVRDDNEQDTNLINLAENLSKTTRDQHSESENINSVYLEHSGANYFFEVLEANNTLRIRRGEISKPCLVFNVSYEVTNEAQKDLERLVKEWKGKGFVVTQANQPIIEGSVADELFAADIKDNSIYSEFFSLGWASEWTSEQRATQIRIFHFRNGLEYEGHFNFEDTIDMGLSAGLIIEGNVQVSGVFSQMTYNYYPIPILITGNLYAQSLVPEYSDIFIKRDVHVENIIYGEYTDTGGGLLIGGDVYGRAWILNGDDYSMYANGTYHLPRYDPNDLSREYLSIMYGDGSYRPPRYNWSNWSEWLSPKIFDFEGNLDGRAVREYIWANKSPLRKGFVFTEFEPEDTQTELEEYQESELEQKMQALILAEDTYGMIKLLETWPERDGEWKRMLNSRLNAPNITANQLERLTKLKEAYINEQAQDLLGTFWNEDSSFPTDKSDKNLVRSIFDTFNERKSLKKIVQLNKTANKQQETDSNKALVMYEQVIELSLEFVEGSYDDDLYDDFNYNYLFALQGKLWCLNDLVGKGKSEYQVEAENLARNLLEYTNNHQTWFYYSEEGQLHRSAELLAHNTLAWYGLKKGQDLIEAGEVATDVLEEALEHINASIEELDYSSEEESYSVVLENKVEILLALGQSYEAYALVYQVQQRFPDLPYFKKVAQTPAYQQWNEEN